MLMGIIPQLFRKHCYFESFIPIAFQLLSNQSGNYSYYLSNTGFTVFVFITCLINANCTDAQIVIFSGTAG